MRKYFFHNGKIITMDERYPRASSVLIGDAKVIALDCAPDSVPDAEKIDLAGKSLLPGFRDAHVHFFQTGIRAIEFDAGRASSEEELFEMLSAWIREKGDVNGYGYSPKNDKLPERSALDRISYEIPIFLRRVDGHSSAVNTKALASIADKLRDSRDCDFERGWLFGSAHLVAERFFLGKTSKEKLIEAGKIVSSYAISKGCSSVCALVPNVDWMRLLLEMKLDIRTVPFLETMCPSEAVGLGLERVGGCIPMVDGSFGSRTALLLEEYSDNPGNYGSAGVRQEDLDSWFYESSKNNLQTAVHAIGDGAVEMVLKSIKNIPNGIKPLRPRIEHAELLTEKQMDEIAMRGIFLSVQPVFEELWGGPEKLYSARLGERWRKTNRYKTLIKKGITLVGGSDSYITPIDPLRGISACLNHPNHDERISLFEAISMFTNRVVISEGLEKDFGTITPGKIADLVILNGDIEKENINKIDIEKTIINGEIKYSRSWQN